MEGFRFRSFVNMLIRPGGCLVKRVGIRPAPPLSFDGLYVLKGQRSLRNEALKASVHSFTTHADTELTIRSLRVSVRIVRMIVGPPKVRYMKIRFLVRCGLLLGVYPGGPCEQRDPSSCPRGNDLFSRSNLLVW